jgi:hypothetical protein
LDTPGDYCRDRASLPEESGQVRGHLEELGLDAASGVGETLRHLASLSAATYGI